MNQPETSAAAVLQRQMEAYNRHDVDAFCALFAPDAVTRLYENDEILASGIEELRALYGRRFRENPNLHLEVQARLVLDNVVVDRELITGFDGGRTLEAIAIHEVRDGLVQRASFVRRYATL
ncbi:MAG: nuclear transport factor 2 family protein [Chloroflexota bacterium]|nr:nuclear transport factor 2 family protein [Chloroflexota bacterium]